MRMTRRTVTGDAVEVRHRARPRPRSAGTSHALMAELVGSNKRVLDVGCDTGYFGEQLTVFGNRVSGVEFNVASAAVAAERLDKVVVGDLEAVDLVAEFGPASFDVVVYGDVLEHLRDPLPVLRQARGLLAPGGSVVDLHAQRRAR